MTGKALLVAYGGGHITMMAPVIAALQKRGFDCTVMALTTGYRKALQLGLQPLGYRDFSTLIRTQIESWLGAVRCWARTRIPTYRPRRACGTSV